MGTLKVHRRERCDLKPKWVFIEQVGALRHRSVLPFPVERPVFPWGAGRTQAGQDLGEWLDEVVLQIWASCSKNPGSSQGLPGLGLGT